MESKKTKVLLLEPHPTAARMLCTMLSAYENLELVRVRSMREAEGLARCWDFDVLMGFLVSEEVDGVAEYIRLKRLAAGRPVVVLSGAASREAADFAVQLGASAVLDRRSLTPQAVLSTLHVVSGRDFEPALAAA